MLIWSFILTVFMGDLFFDLWSVVIDGVETWEVIAIFLYFFKSLLDGEWKVFYQLGNILLFQDIDGLFRLLKILHEKERLFL